MEEQEKGEASVPVVNSNDTVMTENNEHVSSISSNKADTLVAPTQTFTLPPTPNASISSSLKITPSSSTNVDERTTMPPPPTTATKTKVQHEGNHPLGSPGFTKKCTPQRITSAQILLMLKSQPKDLLAATKEHTGGDLKDVENWLQEGDGPMNLKATVKSIILQGTKAQHNGTININDNHTNLPIPPIKRPGIVNGGTWPSNNAEVEEAGCNCKKSKCLKL